MAITLLELRMYLGERIPTGGTEADTLFTDAELNTIILRGASNFELTMGHAWNAKAGILSELIDIAEDGSSRALSKRYDQARRQADVYYRRAVAEDEALASEVPPVVGRGFNAFPKNRFYDKTYLAPTDPIPWS